MSERPAARPPNHAVVDQWYAGEREEEEEEEGLAPEEQGLDGGKRHFTCHNNGLKCMEG